LRNKTDDSDSDTARNSVSRIINKAEVNLAPVEFLKDQQRRRRRIWLAAASILLCASVGAWIWWGHHPSRDIPIARQEAIEAKKGSRTRSMLPDGTTVWLNAGSKLYYDDNFTGATRSVRLEGEAFFDVVKEPHRPFIVHTAGIDIKVLGTAFNVKSYPDDKTVETTLYRGSVKVFRDEESEEKAIQLRPNEKLILPKQAANSEGEVSVQQKSSIKGPITSFTIAHIDSTKDESERLETAWLYSRLEFRGDNFEELARKLERWYNVTIIFTDEKVKKLSFDGSFEGETVEQAFEYLREANSFFNYKINNHEISVGSAE
jgi:ferric-dicitrate binding protein FerR (iron transport regulator)